MNLLFLTLLDFKSYNERNIYCDLLREFVKKGHNVYCISPTERRNEVQTHFEEDGHILKLKIGNTQKTNVIEKGISTVLIEPQFIGAIKKYFKDIKFDLVIYSTPPITFVNAVKYVKKRYGAKTYLLLKDIFPQNAVDLGMMKKSGVKSLLYKYFRSKEKRLYAISDKIGCMSQANADYVLKHNPEILAERVEICPNSIEVTNEMLSPEQKAEIRQKFNIPTDNTVFIYGGNLGRPQDIPFIIECLKANADFDDRFFVICGTGTEYPKLKNYIDAEKPANVLLINGLPKNEYESFVGCCDIGLIFLDHRFTMPNFPSRLLSYMQKGMPVLACTDPNTDIGKVITNGNFGWWCESNSTECFTEAVNTAVKADIKSLGENAFNYLSDNYSSKDAMKKILKGL